MKTRRNVIGTLMLGSFSIPAWAASGGSSSYGNARRKGPVFVATWPFGKPSNEEALKTYRNGGKVLDAVEKGIRLAEVDPLNESVGGAGFPNSAGVLQLDACIMYGPGHKAGSVAGLEGIMHPISVARRVMEKTKHVMLVGEGAKQFALAEGFETIPTITESQKRKWEEWKSKQNGGRLKSPAAIPNHDTIALLGLAEDGTLAGGCSTSGLAYKLPGRVGDSPIIGSGLYLDNAIGAAGATGIGENILRYCGSFMVVEAMRRGATPAEACFDTIQRIARMDPLGVELSINFIALDKKGRFGAAGSGKGFEFAVTTQNFSWVLDSLAVGSKEVGPIGGNRT